MPKVVVNQGYKANFFDKDGVEVTKGSDDSAFEMPKGAYDELGPDGLKAVRLVEGVAITPVVAVSVDDVLLAKKQESATKATGL